MHYALSSLLNFYYFYFIIFSHNFLSHDLVTHQIQSEIRFWTSNFKKTKVEYKNLLQIFFLFGSIFT